MQAGTSNSMQQMTEFLTYLNRPIGDVDPVRVHRPILYTAGLVYRLTKAFTGAESYSVKGHNSEQMSPRSDHDMKGHQFKTLGLLLK